ncbi:hypothetical protein DSL72_001658 [Monilinia vaccinii-corymbosi]|uniref:Survival motor neuron Tudor domain-containing protein n=1 Tax=Monilinia vaccinii-corymbosi TaxID=61207 RepID=A0A8A3PA86_9HELO|nr:hypothetical protein DSL72_001658 [Monilinia vaccinii-corymbosi]
MAPQNNAMHAELWDDSTLVNSWNEALQEYERYHSIHARGERVEDVLNEFEHQDNGFEGAMDEDIGEVFEEPLQENIEVTEQSEFEETDDHTPTKSDPKVDAQPTGKATESHPPSSSTPTLPPQLIGQVHDESLKNLLMSWYYAGYYTGLYEGQQQKQGPSKGT